MTLRLTGNTISPEGAEAIAAALVNRGELQHLLFADIFTGRLKDEIPKAVEFFNNSLNGANAKIITLDLSDNAFGPNGAVAVEPWLNSNCCITLQVLKLNNTGLGVHGGIMIGRGLENLHQLALDNGCRLQMKEFVCGRSRQEIGGTKALAVAFNKIGTLECIEMPQNGILVEGVEALAKCIEQNPGLKKLNINDNTVTEKGANAIGLALKRCSNLESLDIGDCLIRNKGAILLAEPLKSLKKLSHLNLSYNEIHTTGALAIARGNHDCFCLYHYIITLNLAIKHLDVLQKVNLNGNQIGENGCEDLIAEMEAAKIKYKLDSLDEDNEPDESDLEEYSESDDNPGDFEQFRTNPTHQSFMALGKGNVVCIYPQLSNVIAFIHYSRVLSCPFSTAG